MYSWDPEPPDRSHLHYCPHHQETFECECGHPEIEDLICEICDQIEAAETNLDASILKRPRLWRNAGRGLFATDLLHADPPIRLPVPQSCEDDHLTQMTGISALHKSREL